MPAETPCASFSPPRRDSPVFFSHPDQRPSAAASNLVSFSGSECDSMDNSTSLVASDVEELSGLSHDPAPTPSAESSAMPNYSASCLKLWRSWTWSGSHLRSPLAAAWMNVSCRGTIRPFVNEPRHSSLRSMTRSPSHGVYPTRPACVPALSPPSPQSMAPKKRCMTSCLHWMS